MSREHTTLVKLLGLGALVVVTVAIASVTYIAVFNKGRLPPMPRTGPSVAEERESMARLEAQSVDFKPSGEEKVLIQQLEDLHLKETIDQGIQNTGAHLKQLMIQLKTALSAAAERDTPRYLRLGDVLALRFHNSLQRLLTEQARPGPPDDKNRDRNGLLALVRLHGGAFYRKALECGMITDGGRLNTSIITPQVLFRYRWRHLGNIDLTQSLSIPEKRALYDFTARFTPSDTPQRRLEAVDALAALDRSYDVPIAKAVILWQADLREDALRELKRARDNGRADATVSRFIQFLQE